jgi:hypothetical protein
VADCQEVLRVLDFTSYLSIWIQKIYRKNQIRKNNIVFRALMAGNQSANLLYGLLTFHNTCDDQYKFASVMCFENYFSNGGTPLYCKQTGIIALGAKIFINMHKQPEYLVFVYIHDDKCSHLRIYISKMAFLNDSPQEILDNLNHLKSLDIPQYDFAHYPTHPANKQTCSFRLGCELHLCDADVHERTMESMLIEMASITINRNNITIFSKDCSLIRRPETDCSSPRNFYRNEFSVRVFGETSDLLNNYKNTLISAIQ